MLKVEAIARTCEVDPNSGKINAENIGTFAHDSFILGGRAGGTCYAKEGYFSKGIYNTDRAERIAKITSGSGHHSVFEHSYITLLISGIPKIMAMLLNSTSCYVTSEKSARYTVMSPESDLEVTLYDKWSGIFKRLISEKYPDMKIDVDKLAMENARYMTSVFTPTSMVYTVSYRQICYLIYWLEDLKDKAYKYGSRFYRRISESAIELKEQFISVVGGVNGLGNIKLLVPNKCDSFSFFATLNNQYFSDIREFVGDAYTLKYHASTSCLAQIQRHRTTRCEMYFNEIVDEPEFYTPKIIANNEKYSAEWKADLEKLYKAGVYPQAMIVDIVERGLVTDYLMKAQERLCARAQLEIMDNTVWGMYTLKFYKNHMSRHVEEALMKWFDDEGQVKFKCEMKKCLEPCVWGAKYGKNRLI